MNIINEKGRLILNFGSDHKEQTAQKFFMLQAKKYSYHLNKLHDIQNKIRDDIVYKFPKKQEVKQ